MRIGVIFALLILVAASIGVIDAEQPANLFQAVEDVSGEIAAASKVSDQLCVLRHRVVDPDLTELNDSLRNAQSSDDILRSDPLTFQLFEDLSVAVRPTSIRSDSKYGFLIRVIYLQGIEVDPKQRQRSEYAVSAVLYMTEDSLRRGSFESPQWRIGITRSTIEPFMIVYEVDVENCDMPQ